MENVQGMLVTQKSVAPVALRALHLTVVQDEAVRAEFCSAAQQWR